MCYRAVRFWLSQFRTSVKSRNKTPPHAIYSISVAMLGLLLFQYFTSFETTCHLGGNWSINSLSSVVGLIDLTKLAMSLLLTVMRSLRLMLRRRMPTAVFYHDCWSVYWSSKWYPIHRSYEMGQIAKHILSTTFSYLIHYLRATQE